MISFSEGQGEQVWAVTLQSGVHSSNLRQRGHKNRSIDYVGKKTKFGTILLAFSVGRWAKSIDFHNHNPNVYRRPVGRTFEHVPERTFEHVPGIS